MGSSTLESDKQILARSNKKREDSAKRKVLAWEGRQLARSLTGGFYSFLKVSHSKISSSSLGLALFFKLACPFFLIFCFFLKAGQWQD